MRERNIKVNQKSELENKFSFDHFFMKLANALILKKNFNLKNEKH